MDHYRTQPQFAIRHTCSCRLSDGLPVALEIRDVSLRGCTARLGNLPLFMGQGLTLYPHGEELSGSVRSIDDDRVVIEFDKELPADLFEWLRSNFAIDHEIPVPTPPTAAPAMAHEPVPTPDEPAPRAEYGSLSTIDTSRRGKRGFGSKPVLLG